MKVGVLALQGNFQSHRERLASLGVTSLSVRKAVELNAISGLVLPGGESLTMLKLMSKEFKVKLKACIEDGLPVLATCAGTILLAKNIFDPEQDSLGQLDIDVTRNAYGRQKESFIESSLCWTEDGMRALQEVTDYSTTEATNINAVFIRAPKITRTGEGVKTLALQDGEPALVSSGNIIAATFHPELNNDEAIVHRLFLARI